TWPGLSLGLLGHVLRDELVLDAGAYFLRLRGRELRMAGVANVLGCLRFDAYVCGCVPARYQRRVDARRLLDCRHCLFLATKQTEDTHDALLHSCVPQPRGGSAVSGWRPIWALVYTV